MGGRATGYGEDAVLAGGEGIRYRFSRSRRRTLGVTVRPDGAVTVHAPLRASLGEIRSFVEERAPWIRKARASFLARPPGPPPPRYEEGATHFYLGRPYRLELRRGGADGVRLERGVLAVTTRREPSEPAVERLVDGWYRLRGERLFRGRIAHWHRLGAGEGVAAPSLRVRKMTSRWGSYSVAARRVNLSLLLLRAPFPCVDYVVLHELCHGRYRGHGPRFWSLVGKFMPDWPTRRKALGAWSA